MGFAGSARKCGSDRNDQLMGAGSAQKVETEQGDQQQKKKGGPEGGAEGTPCRLRLLPDVIHESVLPGRGWFNTFFLFINVPQGVEDL